MDTATQTTPKRYQCPHCGAVLETDDPIEGIQVPCPECGGEFIAVALPQATSHLVKLSNLFPVKKTRKAWMWGILGTVLLVIAAGTAWWFKSKNFHYHPIGV